MTRRTASIPPAWFEELYAADPDPWAFASSDYEREKYAATLAALPRQRFAAGLEVGCSIGILTRALASRCGSMLGVDVSEAALARARKNAPSARFERRCIPAEWPPGRFDLIVFSEMLYYLDGADTDATAQCALAALSDGGSVLLVHYLGETDYPQTGDAAAARFIAATGLRPAIRLRADRYRIDRLDHPARPPE